MDFLKKHYEKILLGVMLAGLIGVLVFMLFYIASDKQKMEELGTSLIHHRINTLSNLDLTLEASSLARLKAPYPLDLETTNKLLNPMDWQKNPNGDLIPKKNTGAAFVKVTSITPLYTIFSLASATTNELGPRYVVKVERQAAATPNKRIPMSQWISPGDKPNKDFALEAVKGPPENPDALVIKIADSGNTETISQEKPYRRVDGYVADFSYPPENKTFKGKRVGDHAPFAGVDYVVVDINTNELTLEDQSNHKKTSLPFTP